MALPYWRLSAFYFCYFATLGAFLPFWSLYLKHKAFTADEIGELTALLLATKLIAPQLFGWLTDRSGRRMAWIRLTCLLSAVLFGGFISGEGYLWFAGVSLSFSMFWNATLPQFEAATLFHLHNRLSHHYSRIRLWGSIGFIVAVLGIGRLLDRVGPEPLPYLIISLLSLNFLVALSIPDAGSHHNSDARQGLLAILSRRETLAFLTVYLFLQIAHGPYYVFFSMYLKHHGYSASVTGWLWAWGVAAEIALFMLAGGLLRRFSLWCLLLSSLLLTTLRWWMTAHLVADWAWLLVAQSLHAASFGLAHVVAIQLLYQYFGHQHQGQGQALYSGLSFGLGGMLGSLLSGYFWDRLGGDQVFLIAMASSLIATLIVVLAMPRCKPSSL